MVPGVDISSFGGVVEEGGVPWGGGGLPVPLPGVPREILNKTSFEDPEDWSLLAWGLQFLGNSETRPGAFLGENSDRKEGAGGDGDYLVGGGLNALVRRHSFEFDRSGLARSCVEDEVDPFEGGAD